jgi:hypothetical protein
VTTQSTGGERCSPLQQILCLLSPGIPHTAPCTCSAVFRRPPTPCPMHEIRQSGDQRRHHAGGGDGDDACPPWRGRSGGRARGGPLHICPFHRSPLVCCRRRGSGRRAWKRESRHSLEELRAWEQGSRRWGPECGM